MYQRRRSQPRIMLANRRVNFRFLAWETGILAFAIVILVGLHSYQKPRNAQFLYSRAQSLYEGGNLDEAIRYLRLYLGMIDSDRDAYAQLARWLTEVDSTDALYEAYDRLLQVLRREPSRNDYRAAVIELALEIGENRQALAQAELLEPVADENPQWWHLIARTYTLNGELERALVAYQQLLEQAPQNLIAYREYIGLDFEKYQDKTRLAEQIDQMLSRNRENPTAHLLAYSLRRDQDLEGAVAALDAAKRMAPDNLEVLLMDAGEAIRTGSADAGQKLMRLSEQHGNDPRVLLLHGKWKQGQGDVVGALELFRKGLTSSEAKDPEFAWRAADLLIQLNRPKQARALLPTVQTNPFYGPANHYLRGRLALRQGEFDTAKALFEDGLRGLSSPFDRVALGDSAIELQMALFLGVATVEYQQGNLPQAIVFAEYAHELLPEVLLPTLTLGSFYLEAGQYELAVQFWRKALEQPLVPQPVYFELARSLLYLEREKPINARSYTTFENAYDAALRATPDAPDLVALRAEFFFLKNEVDQALLILESGVQGHPKNLSLAISLLRAYTWTGRLEQATRQGQSLSKRFRLNSAIAVSLAQLSVAKGNLSRAQQILANGLKRLPESQHLPLLLSQANLNWHKNDTHEALASLEKATATFPNSDIAWACLFHFLLETERTDQARSLIGKWSQDSELEGLSRWGRSLLLAKQASDLSRAKESLAAEHAALRLNRPYWWGAEEVAGLLAEAEGDTNRAWQFYRDAIWTGPALSFVLNRFQALPAQREREVDRRQVVESALRRRISVPADPTLPPLEEADAETDE